MTPEQARKFEENFATYEARRAARKQKNGSAKPLTVHPIAEALSTIVPPIADIPEPVRLALPRMPDRYKAPKLTPFYEAGWTFRIDGVSDPYDVSGEKRRAVRIILDRQDGARVVRVLLFGTSLVSREAFLERASALWRACSGPINGRFRLVSEGQGFGIADHVGEPCFTTLEPEAEPKPSRSTETATPASLNDVLARYSAPGFEAVQQGREVDGRTFFKVWNVAAGPDPIPLTIAVRQGKDGPYATPMFEAHIDAHRPLQDHAETPDGTTHLHVMRTDAHGTIEPRKVDLNRITETRDNPLSTLLNRHAFSMETPAQRQNVRAFFNMLMLTMPPPATRQKHLAWHILPSGGLRFVSNNAVEDARKIVSHDAAGIYPPLVDPRDPMAQVTSPTDDDFRRVTRKARLKVMRTFFEDVNPSAAHLHAALLGHMVYTLAPYRTVKAEAGRTPFLLEIFGATGFGKTPMVSMYALLQGVGFMAERERTSVGGRRSTFLGSHGVMSSHPNLVSQVQDQKKDSKNHAILVDAIFDGTAETRAKRRGGHEFRASVTGGFISTAEEDLQFAHSDSADEESTAARMCGIPCGSEKPNGKIADWLNMHENRLAFGLVGTEFRRWIMQNYSGSESGTYNECVALARKECEFIRDIDPKLYDHAWMLATGVLYFSRFVDEVYRKPAASIVAWLRDKALRSLVTLLIARAGLVRDGARERRQADENAAIREAIRKMCGDGNAHFKVPDDALRIGTDFHREIARNGYEFESFGYVQEERGKKIKPRNPARRLGFVTFKGGRWTLNIPTEHFRVVTDYVDAVNARLRNSKLDEKRPTEIQAALAEISRHDDKGFPRERNPEGAQVRCYVIDLWAIFPDASGVDPSEADQDDARASGEVVNLADARQAKGDDHPEVHSMFGDNADV